MRAERAKSKREAERERLCLDVDCAHAAWRLVRRLKSRLRRAAQAVFASLPESLRCDANVTLLLGDDETVRKLNATFRKKNRPTNVLSFPQFEPPELRSLIRQRKTLRSPAKRGDEESPLYLGDVAMAWETVRAEAARDGKSVIDHTTHLVVHGLLHLYGYDHVRAAQAERMESLEIAIMKDLGIPNPYRVAPPRGSCKIAPNRQHHPESHAENT